MSQKKDPQILFTQASETSFSGPLGYSALHFGWNDSYSMFFRCFKIGGGRGLALFLSLCWIWINTVLVFWPWGMQDLVSGPGIRLISPCIGRQSLNSWISREVPLLYILALNVLLYFNSVQLSRLVKSDSATPWTSARQASLSITNSQSLPKHMSIESVMPSNHLIPCRPLLLLPSVFSQHQGLSNESVLHIRWPKYWSFSFNISPSNEHSGLISFRMDWLGLLVIQGTLKSLLQHHSSKAQIL